MNKKNSFYFIGCLLLAIFAEVTLFTEKIGISLSFFVVAYYVFYFYMTKKETHTHRIVGIYIFICIWTLTLSFVFVANPPFYAVNLLVIFLLIGVHTILITSPSFLSWSNVEFLWYMQKKFSSLFKFSRYLSILVRKRIKEYENERNYAIAKRILLGIVIVLPILFVLIFLLSSSDQYFSILIEKMITHLVSFNIDKISIFLRILLVFVFLVLWIKTISKKSVIILKDKKEINRSWEQATLLTILISINGLYLFYTIFEFQYFFNDVLMNGFTYATYAKRGFFELIIVTIINISITLLVNRFSKSRTILIKTSLSLLIIFSFIILLSAHLRLSLYEQAYGYTYLRLFSHSFIFLLAVLFAFTMIKIWIEKIQLMRIFLLLALLYYCGLNVIDVDRFIVSKNLERFEETNLIDLQYIESLSLSTVPVLMNYYERNREMNSIKHVLLAKKELLEKRDVKWQSYNMMEDRARKLLASMNLDDETAENENGKKYRLEESKNEKK
ncbi:DUF4153 domain-containing protein [Niallia sp. Sow4_A1]|uniref:DUF4173 domain-containing protein n=1 Tax=Niallia hominis TaxID=3133173 RepID=A0ABV1F4X4_9BACI|nr:MULTISPECIES: DUF4173 domain-containing protein [Bacillaceae]MCF2649615.1 DUF4173 domain-containing protein [Niallia circulans]MCM3362120.1 DUF4173 domain-containing protein [Niallia sp. MER TA 168]CAI9386750.1 hypothetical protein BACSP_01736 [Bacillus sp. T2.9-1]